MRSHVSKFANESLGGGSQEKGTMSFDGTLVKYKIILFFILIHRVSTAPTQRKRGHFRAD